MPSFTCKQFCYVLNSPRHSYVLWMIIWDTGICQVYLIPPLKRANGAKIKHGRIFPCIQYSICQITYSKALSQHPKHKTELYTCIKLRTITKFYSLSTWMSNTADIVTIHSMGYTGISTATFGWIQWYKILQNCI